MLLDIKFKTPVFVSILVYWNVCIVNSQHSLPQFFILSLFLHTHPYPAVWNIKHILSEPYHDNVNFYHDESEHDKDQRSQNGYN